MMIFDWDRASDKNYLMSNFSLLSKTTFRPGLTQSLVKNNIQAWPHACENHTKLCDGFREYFSCYDQPHTRQTKLLINSPCPWVSLAWDTNSRKCQTERRRRNEIITVGKIILIRPIRWCLSLIAIFFVHHLHWVHPTETILFEFPQTWSCVCVFVSNRWVHVILASMRPGLYSRQEVKYASRIFYAKYVPLKASCSKFLTRQMNNLI